MFIDIAKIKVKAGDGGDGAVAFHREKYVASGGPDGGDGGRGGDIVFRVDDNLSTLADFRYKRKYTAERGENGRGKRCFGKSAQPLVITVPRGTLIRNAETGRIMADMSTDEDVVIAKGGRGGWGNTHFASPTRQTPRFAKPGTPGEAFEQGSSSDRDDIFQGSSSFHSDNICIGIEAEVVIAKEFLNIACSF